MMRLVRSSHVGSFQDTLINMVMLEKVGVLDSDKEKSDSEKD